MNQYAAKACRITVLAALTAATLLTAAASAGTVNLAQVPLISGLAKIVPPNLFLVLDDSSSTVNDYMPDGVGDMKSSRCFRNWGYNKLYYNPAITYSPPSKTGKTETQPTQQWTEAWKNGFNENDGKTDLSKTTTTTEAVPKEMGANPFSVTNGSTTVTVTQTSHGYTSGAQLVFTNLTNSSGKAITAVGSVPINAQPAVAITVLNSNQYQFTASKAATQTTTGGGQGPIATTFIQVNIASYYTEYKPNPQNPSAACESDADYINKVPSTSAEKTNFANWYSYYRTRELILKSTIGRAFATLDSNFRVGYAVLNNVTTNEGSNSRFRKIRPFTDNNKEPWYVSFYGGKADPSSGETPLRAGLARAGQMYAGVVNGLNGNNDPVQYSCQQNFTLLATDGYWTQAGESKNYGPYQMDGATAVGDQDSDTMKFRAPYLDGNKVANTLADVAAYYYNTDLRTSGQTGGPSGADGSGPKLDVSTNNVPPVNGDKASWQHMNTFALGLGVNGELVYSPDYLQGGSADYNAILAGSKNWPNPNPSNTDTQITARIDDLWHAAVNGHGQYFNATNPDTISASLKTMLAAISCQRRWGRSGGAGGSANHGFGPERAARPKGQARRGV